MHKANPVRASDYLEENNERDRYLEIAEIERLEAECARELQTVVRVAIGTGMRRGEIAGLQWTDVDFAQNFIFVRRSGPEAYSPKSGKNRVIPMCRFVREALQNQPRSVDTNQVFKTVHADGFKAAVKRAGLYTENEALKVTFHTLRNTFASYLAIKAIDLYRIAKLLGDTLGVVEKRYAHLQPKHLQEVYAIDAIWQPALIENKKKISKVNARVAKSADATDLKSVRELNPYASSSLAPGTACDGHHIDTRRDSGKESISRKRGNRTDLKSVGKLNSCASSSLAPGIFIRLFR